MKSILQCVLIASVVLSACNTAVDRVQPPPGRHSGSVQFMVLDRWGFADNYKVLRFRMAKETPDLAATFNGLSASNVPFGIYDYDLGPQAGAYSQEPISGTVTVSRDQVHVSRLLSTEGLGHLATFPVAGVIEPRPTGAVWVIIENVYGGRRMESTLDAAGTFQVGDIKGNNIIIVCVGSEVLTAAPSRSSATRCSLLFA